MALLTAACPLLAGRFDLDVPAATRPAGPDHRGVDATRDLPPRLVEDLRNPLVEPVIGHVLSSSRIGLLIIAFRVREVERACASSWGFLRLPSLGLLAKPTLLSAENEETATRWENLVDVGHTGFVQPLRPHQYWHIDIAHLNLGGTFYHLCSILDGASRAIVHWDIRESETDVECILQRAHEMHPDEKPRIISDNGRSSSRRTSRSTSVSPA